MQLGAGTVWFCLSQCAILFCTLSPFNLPSLPNLLERSTCGVDEDGDLAIEDDVLGGFREL